MGSKVEFNAHAQLCMQCDRKMAVISGPGTHLPVHVQSGCRTLLTKIRFTPLNVTFAELFCI